MLARAHLDVGRRNPYTDSVKERVVRKMKSQAGAPICSERCCGHDHHGIIASAVARSKARVARNHLTPIFWHGVRL